MPAVADPAEEPAKGPDNPDEDLAEDGEADWEMAGDDRNDDKEDPPGEAESSLYGAWVNISTMIWLAMMGSLSHIALRIGANIFCSPWVPSVKVESADEIANGVIVYESRRIRVKRLGSSRKSVLITCRIRLGAKSCGVESEETSMMGGGFGG